MPHFESLSEPSQKSKMEAGLWGVSPRGGARSAHPRTYVRTYVGVPYTRIYDHDGSRGSVPRVYVCTRVRTYVPRTAPSQKAPRMTRGLAMDGLLRAGLKVPPGTQGPLLPAELEEEPPKTKLSRAWKLMKMLYQNEVTRWRTSL